MVIEGRKVLLPFYLLLFLPLTALAQVTVSTTNGKVSGIDQEGTMAFLGIPYAKVERFMPPQPVEKWQGIRACDHWGPMTMQQTNRPMTEEQMSENCCVLNVWTTDLKAKKPVLLWLQGSGISGSFGSGLFGLGSGFFVQQAEQ